MNDLILKSNSLSMECIEAKDYEQALRLLSEVKSILENPDFSVPNNLKAMTYNNLGCIYKRLRQHSMALTYFKSALRYEKSDFISLGGIYLNLCSMSSAINKHTEALEYAHKASEMFQKTGLKESLAVSMYSTGVEYTYLKQFKLAKETFYESYNLAVSTLGPYNELTKKIQREAFRKSPPKRPSKLNQRRSVNSSVKLLNIKRSHSSFRDKPSLHFDNRIHFIEKGISRLNEKIDSELAKRDSVNSLIEESSRSLESKQDPYIAIQSLLRGFLQRRETKQTNDAVVCIQKRLRTFRIRMIYSDIKMAVLLIQSFYKLYRYKKYFKTDI